MKGLTIIIPAFNEETNIGHVIDRIQALYSKEKTEPKGYCINILVVNDGSNDATEEIAKSKGATVISHSRNMGLGAASRTALETAYELGADIAVKIDGDLQYDPEDIEKVIMPILQNKISGIAKGSPVVKLFEVYVAKTSAATG